MATMNPTMIPDNQHNDIPGNPSTAKSSNVKLRTEARYLDSKEAIFFDNKSNNFFVTTSLSFEF